MAFPKDFVWGAAAASYQIEGAAFEDGKGWSVWDRFVRKRHAIARGHTGDVACDHYHRYTEDVQLMQRIGLQGYRMSLSWPRILPDGSGQVNAKGLDFYSRLIDALLEAEIQPWVTLFHWDYPLALFNRGGWLNRDSVEWFGEYAGVVADALGDRVRHWMTLNEPQVFLGLGHYQGEHAPGLRMSWADVLQATHHALMAHGRAVQVIRDRASADGTQVGYAPVAIVRLPADESPASMAAAHRATFAVERRDTWNTPWFTEPVFNGQYPEDGLRLFADDLPEIHDEDLSLISQPLDFVGMNCYFGEQVGVGEDGTPVPRDFAPGHPRTGFDWPVTPDAMYWAPKWLHERYQLPIVVTENGISNLDWVHLDGKVHDPQRIDFTTRYLRALHRAGEEGVPLKGYFHWSILDNFEWSVGYWQRFGLVYVDYQTQARIPKDSAAWYADVIKTNGANALT
jgi:beta-glucosidase